MADPIQLRLDLAGTEEIQEAQKPEGPNGRANKLNAKDRAFHDWYRFVLSFPPHLVREYINKFALNQKSIIEQDIELCEQRFPHLICRAIAAKSIEDNLIVLFEFEQTDDGIKVSSEKHYRLVEPNELSSEELQSYAMRQN